MDLPDLFERVHQLELSKIRNDEVVRKLKEDQAVDHLTIKNLKEEGISHCEKITSLEEEKTIDKNKISSLELELAASNNEIATLKNTLKDTQDELKETQVLASSAQSDVTSLAMKLQQKEEESKEKDVIILSLKAEKAELEQGLATLEREKSIVDEKLQKAESIIYDSGKGEEYSFQDLCVDHEAKISELIESMSYQKKQIEQYKVIVAALEKQKEKDNRIKANTTRRKIANNASHIMAKGWGQRFYGNPDVLGKDVELHHIRHHHMAGVDDENTPENNPDGPYGPGPNSVAVRKFTKRFSETKDDGRIDAHTIHPEHFENEHGKVAKALHQGFVDVIQENPNHSGNVNNARRCMEHALQEVHDNFKNEQEDVAAAASCNANM